MKFQLNLNGNIHSLKTYLSNGKRLIWTVNWAKAPNVSSFSIHITCWYAVRWAHRRTKIQPKHLAVHRPPNSRVQNSEQQTAHIAQRSLAFSICISFSLSVIEMGRMETVTIKHSVRLSMCYSYSYSILVCWTGHENRAENVQKKSACEWVGASVSVVAVRCGISLV